MFGGVHQDEGHRQRIGHQQRAPAAADPPPQEHRDHRRHSGVQRRNRGDQIHAGLSGVEQRPGRLQMQRSPAPGGDPLDELVGAGPARCASHPATRRREHPRGRETCTADPTGQRRYRPVCNSPPPTAARPAPARKPRARRKTARRSGGRTPPTRFGCTARAHRRRCRAGRKMTCRCR